MSRGKFIVIEGIDGSGKGTQTSFLTATLASKNIPVGKMTFPDYKNNFFGGEVGKYLNGVYGTDTHPKLISLLYALDRYESKDNINGALDRGINMISDRYVSSNIAFQSAKLPESEQEDFMNYIRKVEYEILRLPKPDLTIFLNIPPEISYELVLEKAKREYTDNKRDIHEADIDRLEKAHRSYKAQAELDGWAEIDCLDSEGKLRTIEGIADQVLYIASRVIGITKPSKYISDYTSISEELALKPPFEDYFKKDKNGLADSIHKIDDTTTKIDAYPAFTNVSPHWQTMPKNEICLRCGCVLNLTQGVLCSACGNLVTGGK